MTGKEETLLVHGKRIQLFTGGGGAPLLYLHGAGTFWWMPVHDRLASRRCVYLPVHPGFGASEGYDAIEDMEDLVFHTIDVMDALGLSRVDVVGLSLGGWLAAELALRHPARVGRLVLVDAAGTRVPGVERGDLFLSPPAKARQLLFADPQSELARTLVPDAPPPERVETALRGREAAARLIWHPHRMYRIKILVLGNALPLYDHPLRVAEELAMLDVLSAGRLIAGMVVGLGVEAFTYEVNPTFVRERYREAHDLIVRSWTEPGPFHFEGKHYDFRYVNVWPRPYQEPHPPIWIPGSGSMETIRWVAERRYPWIALPFSQFEVMKEHFDMLREYAAAHCGYEVPPAQVGWPAMIYVAETDARAREEFEPHFWYLAKKLLKLPREYMFPPGHTSVESQLRPGHAKRKFISLLHSWKEAEDGLYAIVGSPETVRQKLREGIKASGCGIIQGIFQVGSLPHELAMKNIELFAREVMPALRAKFP